MCLYSLNAEHQCITYSQYVVKLYIEYVRQSGLYNRCKLLFIYAYFEREYNIMYSIAFGVVASGLRC